MNSRILRFAVLPLFAFAIAGCGGPDPTEEAHATLDVVFKALKRSDLEGALMLYSPSFFKTTPRQQWLQQLQQIHATLGPVQSFEILDTVSEKKKTPSPGTYVQFTCQVNYQRGALNETVILVRPEGLQSYTISGHRIIQPQQQAAAAGAPPQQQAPQQQQPQPAAAAPPQQQPQAPPAQPQAPPAQPQTPPAATATPPAQPQTPPAATATPPAQPQTPPAAPVTPPAPQPTPTPEAATPPAPAPTQ